LQPALPQLELICYMGSHSVTWPQYLPQAKVTSQPLPQSIKADTLFSGPAVPELI